jgi:hypothetical protein
VALNWIADKEGFESWSLPASHHINRSLKSERHAAFCSLVCTNNNVVEKFAALSAPGMAAIDELEIDTSDGICADYIIEKLSGFARGTAAAIDYLQILDQNRRMPLLATQVSALKALTKNLRDSCRHE